ncbi:hypothetical protein EDB83DRAFT_2522331 [Lactarius deliciosus]|nr:hypothetical protein EDB83DRAFT_2522331 [Lactarius deliciosus]
MAVSGTHTATGQTNLGASEPQLNNAAREVYYIKGSIDALLARCKFYQVAEDSTPALDADMRSIIAGRVARARDGVRLRQRRASHLQTQLIRAAPCTVSLRQRPHEQQQQPQWARIRGEREDGFVAMLDPPQVGGVHVMVITGDAEETALSVARSLGLLRGAGACLTGSALDRVSAWATLAVPGVNDAPMGKSGTDVAKEAADVFLVDDNFSTILPAVEESQYSNISQLSTAAAALTLITLSTIFIVVGTLFVYYFALSDDQRMSRRDQTTVHLDRLAHSTPRQTFSCFVFLDLISAVQNRVWLRLDAEPDARPWRSRSCRSSGSYAYPFMQAIFRTSALPLDDLLLLFALTGAEPERDVCRGHGGVGIN